jgi:hypothetical protein
VSEPLRVAFVGRASEAGHAVPAQPVDGLHATFVEHRAGRAPTNVLAHVATHDPDVVVVFGIGSLPAAAVRRIAAPVVAWTLRAEQPPGVAHHPDLPQASERYREGQATARDYARVIDRPLPVADEHLGPPRSWSADPRILVIGHSSDRCERLLVDSKHRHELLHIAGGLHGAALSAALAGAEVAIDVRAEDTPHFGPRVALYLAAGLLLLSEPLHPLHGLRAGGDHLEFRDSAQLVELLRRVRADPAAFTTVRDAGRDAAEALRASRVYPDVLAPLAAARA